MTETPCLFGLTNVRVGTRVIAIFHFWLEFFNALLLFVKYCVKWQARTHIDNKTIESYNLTFGYKEIDLEIYTFSEISNAIMVMYTCYHLRKATYHRNFQYIHFWMIVNCINFATSIGFFVFALLRLRMLEIFVVGLLSLAFECYKLFVVYTFYMDELYSVPAESAIVNCSNDGQNTIAQNNVVLSNGVVDQPISRNHHVVELAPEKTTNDRY